MEDWRLPLVEAGVDVLHCSQRRFWDPEFPEIDGENGLNCVAVWPGHLRAGYTVSLGNVALDSSWSICDYMSYRSQVVSPR